MCTVLYVWFRDQLRSERMSPSLDSTFQLRGMKAACFKDTLCETTGAGLGFVVWSWQCCLCLAVASIGHSELAFFLWFPHMRNCAGVIPWSGKKKVPRFGKVTENTSTRLLGILYWFDLALSDAGKNTRWIETFAFVPWFHYLDRNVGICALISLFEEDVPFFSWCNWCWH